MDKIQELHLRKDNAIQSARVHRAAGEHVYIIQSLQGDKPAFYVEDGTPLIRTWEKEIKF